MSSQAVKQQLKALQVDNEGRARQQTSQKAAKAKEEKSQRKLHKKKQQAKLKSARVSSLESKSRGKRGGQAARQHNLKQYLDTPQSIKDRDTVNKLMLKALGMPDSSETVEETDEDLSAWFD